MAANDPNRVRKKWRAIFVCVLYDFKNSIEISQVNRPGVIVEV